MRECQTVEDGKTIEKYQQHVSLYQAQYKLFSEHKLRLPPGVVLLVFDFSTVHDTSLFKLKDLNFTAYWRDSRKILHHRYYDHWSTEKKDYNYTISGMQSLATIARR